MVRIIIKVLSILVIIGSIGYSGYYLMSDSLHVRELSDIPTNYVETNYVSIDDNSGKTTLNGVGNVYINTISKGFHVEREAIDANRINVVFTNGDEVRRYNYDKNTKILSFLFKPYESTVTGSAYIIEGND